MLLKGGIGGGKDKNEILPPPPKKNNYLNFNDHKIWHEWSRAIIAKRNFIEAKLTIKRQEKQKNQKNRLDTSITLLKRRSSTLCIVNDPECSMNIVA